jgi:hypothetical protein
MVSDFMFWATIVGLWYAYFIVRYRQYKISKEIAKEIDAMHIIIGSIFANPEIIKQLKIELTEKTKEKLATQEVIDEMKRLKREAQ